MFRGIANISVDAKGRIAIPKIHRTRFEVENSTELMVTAGPDRCLLIYQMHEWLPTEQKIMSLPNGNPHNRRMQRMYVGHATETEIDNNGRILVPNVLRDYASIGKKAVIVGQGNKLELWGEEVWNDKSALWPEELSDFSSDEMSQDIREMSI